MWIKYLINKAENIKMSFWQGLLWLYIVMFLRTFLENFANSGNLYHMSGIIDTFFHYPIGFSLVIMGSFIIATIATGEEISKVAKFIILCSFGLLVPPIVDLVINQGAQIPYIFNSGSYAYLLKSFITFFGGGAIGLGIKIETVAAMSGLGFYIYEKTKKIGRALAGAFLLYLMIFLFLASPTLIFGIYNTFTREYQSVTLENTTDFYYHKEVTGAATAGRTFVLENQSIYPAWANQYSITLSIAFLLIHAILLFVCIFLYSRKKFRAVVKNLRYLRIAHNSILILLGVFLGLAVFPRNTMASLFDLLSYISLFGAFLFAWLFAVWENDEADVQIDKLSNSGRPLAQTETILSPEEWQNLKYVFLVYALLFAFLAGFYVFVFILLFTFLYHIYSAPPLRLKRFPGISSLLVAANSLILVWLGFFMTAGTENLSAFPAKYTLGILGIFFLVENAKNLKDIEGDRQDGIKTLPVIFGEKWGKFITGGFLFLGSLLVPITFYFDLYTFLASVFFGLIFFLLAIRKNYKEKYLFFAYFIYVVVFFILLGL